MHAMQLNRLHFKSVISDNSSLGANIKLMDSGELGMAYPWLRTDDLSIGTVGKIKYIFKI